MKGWLAIGIVIALFVGGCSLKLSVPGKVALSFPRKEATEQESKAQEQVGVYHLVRRGETLWRISKTYGVSMDEIMRANNIEDPNLIKAGEYIFIPGAEAVREVVPYKDEKVQFAWPLRGRITSKFGPRWGRMHKGIDIAAPEGTPIRAAEDGVVIYSGNGLRGYGNVVIIEHRGGFSTVYAHNSVNLVKEGDKVRKGDIIAKVGSTGRSTGPHLHFEIRKDAVAQDPLKYLP